ncbi:hypothetical protein JHL18_12970 [Clostridium sp. YIM B02505]|uniref:DUF4935 domain-containing protein n=1 Tax=Clostridium yunnanense TaxID=2800325 RepID=A0ABS1EQG5_9CLOT|nr:hypothetical protein [Clostridium yunnanense]MBK1811533.1 hypothetical protein [Clostridium yunnanense]
MKIGENIYKLILLDTNALREIVTNTNLSGEGFFSKFFKGKDLYAPCFSIYNVIELMPYEDIYEKFLDFFSKVPSLMIYPAKTIIQEEYQKYLNGQTLQITNKIANVFSPLVNNESYNCKKFFEKIKCNTKLMKTIQDEIAQLSSVAKSWEQQRLDSRKILNNMKLSSEIIDEKFYKMQERETIIKDLSNWGIKPQKTIDITALNSLRIMEYSQFNRVYMTNKKVLPNDVMDIKISCIIPYIDAVITENFQANIYIKARKLIPRLNKLEIYTLRDIRMNERQLREVLK